MQMIAVLSDIHGNLPALQAVLRDIRRQDIEECFVLGDLIGYYHRPFEVFRLLDESGLRISMIRGNHERMLAQALEGDMQWDVICVKYGHGLEMAVQQFPKDRLQELLSLPDQRQEVRNGKTFLLCHGSPVDQDQYIYPDASDESLDFQGIEADYVLLGHTHYPMVRHSKHVCVVNPGAVGQARTRGGYADWCTIHTGNGVVTMHETPYNRTAVLADCERYDPTLAYLRDVLLRR